MSAGIKEGLFEQEIAVDYLLWRMNQRIALEQHLPEEEKSEQMPPSIGGTSCSLQVRHTSTHYRSPPHSPSRPTTSTPSLIRFVTVSVPCPKAASATTTLPMRSYKNGSEMVNSVDGRSTIWRRWA